MKFWKRLRVYLIGVGLGVGLSYYIFGTRGCNWTPSNRVKRSIFSNPIYTSKEINCRLQCIGVDSAAVYEYINNADIDFSLSKTQADPKVYHLSHLGEIAKFELRKKSTYIQKWHFMAEDCTCSEIEEGKVQLMSAVDK